MTSANSVLQQLLGSASQAVESPYGTPADGPVADGVAPAEEAPAQEEATPAPEFVSPYDTKSEPEEAPKEAETPAPVVDKPATEDRDAAFRAVTKEKNEYRREMRRLQERLAALENAKAGPAKTEPVPPPVSTQPIVFNEPDPVETYLVSVNNDPEAAVPAKVMREHAAWQDRKFAAVQSERERQAALKLHEQESQRKQQETASAESTQQTQYGQAFEKLAEGELSEAKIGEGLGLADIHELAGAYLSEADKDSVRKIGAARGPDAMWRAYYGKCIKALEGSGLPEEAILRQRAQSVLAARRPVAPSPTGPSVTPAKPVASKPKPTAPTRAQILPPQNRGVKVLKNMGFDV